MGKTKSPYPKGTHGSPHEREALSRRYGVNFGDANLFESIDSISSRIDTDIAYYTGDYHIIPHDPVVNVAVYTDPSTLTGRDCQRGFAQNGPHSACSVPWRITARAYVVTLCKTYGLSCGSEQEEKDRQHWGLPEVSVVWTTTPNGPWYFSVRRRVKKTGTVTSISDSHLPTLRVTMEKVERHFGSFDV